MRFRRLEFTAFGPFSSEVLDLSGGGPGGLHVVFGPNEAGKSTSLRAVRGFLFGIPQRSTDAHLHPLSRLEVRAELDHEGEMFAFRRIKRSRDTLLDGTGNPVPEASLRRILRGLDEKTFTSRLGLDQTELERGAEALLGGSEQGLFAAGTAGAEVRTLLAELEAETERLYRPKGKVPELNRAAARLHEATRAAADAVRPPEKWLEQKRAEEEARARAEALKKKRAEVRAEHGQKSRLASLLSDLSNLAEVRRRLEALGTVPAIDESAVERRLDAERDLRDAEIELGHAESAWADIERELRELGAPDPFADVADEALGFEKRLGWEYKAREDRPKLELRLGAGLDRLVELGRRLGIDVDRSDAIRSIELVLPTPADERRIRRLVLDEGVLRTELEEAERKLFELAAELRSRSDEPKVDRAPEWTRLSASLARAREIEALDPRLEALRERILGLEARKNELEKLGHLTREAGDEALPDVEGARRAEAELDRLDRARVELERSSRQDEAALRELAARIVEVRAGKDLPSEASLTDTRRARDRLVDAGSRGEPVDWPGLEAAIGAADRVADELRAESVRLALLDDLERERARLARGLDERKNELEDLAERRLTLVDEWERALARAGFESRARGSLVRRFEAARELGSIEAELDSLRVRRSDRERERAEAVRELSELLGREATDPLGGLVAEAGRRLSELEREIERERARSERRAELALSVGPAEARVAHCRSRAEKWKSEFEGALSRMRLSPTSAPADVEEHLSIFAELSRVLDDAREKERRLKGIDRDSDLLRADVERVVERLAPELLGRDLLELVSEVLRRVARARALDVERERLRRAERGERERLARVRARLAQASQILDGLCRAAGVRSLVELPEAEARAREMRTLVVRRQKLEDALAEKSAGRALDELVEEAARVDHKMLFAEIEELSLELEDLDERVRDAETEASRLDQGLLLYRSEDAALRRQEAANRNAELRVLLRRYLVHRTASELLGREMGRYAERYAGPLAERAGRLFERLTLGRYRGLRVRLGESTIRAVRDGREVEVAELSRGTRAQLYWALRVASLEAYFDENPPVPLLLDDLFVDFDDDRATSAFEILGELAERVQILYFTHLGRDVFLSHDALPKGRVFEHRLSTGSGNPGG